MNIKTKLIIAFYIAAAPIFCLAQSGTTSVGITSNTTEYSSTITIGETINTYSELDSYALKSGIIQPIELLESNVLETDQLVFEITPNPASNFIQITTNTSAFSEYTIFDANSKVMAQGDGTDTSISISEIPAGVYTIKLRSDKAFYSQLFVKI